MTVKRSGVVVVGAGIIGLTIAFQLVRRGVRVTVLERGEVGAAASGDTLAMINATAAKTQHYYAVRRNGFDAWSRLERHLAGDVSLVWGDRLFLESSSARIDAVSARARRLQSWGHPARVVELEELARLEPGLRIDAVAAADLRESEAWVDVDVVTRVLAERVVAGGGQLLRPRDAVDFALADGQVNAVITDREQVPCDSVVLAAGIATTSLASKLGLALPQKHMPGVIVRTAPLPRLFQSFMMVGVPGLTDDANLLLFQAPDGALIACEGDILRSDASKAYSERLLEHACRWFPALANATPRPSTATLRPMPLDGMPAIGFSATVPNAYVAVMHSGITLAPLVGELAAMELVDGVDVDMLRPYRPGRFTG